MWGNSVFVSGQADGWGGFVNWAGGGAESFGCCVLDVLGHRFSFRLT